VRRIFAEGHTIGTHSEDHPVLFGKLPPPLVEWEIDKVILDVGLALAARYLPPGGGDLPLTADPLTIHSGRA
jgi:hypothetical protein